MYEIQDLANETMMYKSVIFYVTYIDTLSLSLHCKGLKVNLERLTTKGSMINMGRKPMSHDCPTGQGKETPFLLA